MVATGNVGVAFGLVAAAGMCTTIGAAVVWCASLAQPRLLAGSLGFAAGVMLYVSFAEILMRKSVAAFQSVDVEGGGDINTAFRWSTLCFFGGMVVVAILDRIVHFMADWGARRQMRKGGGGGCSHSHNSTTNLLTHEDQRNARSTRGGAAPADSPPAVASMRKSGALPGSAAAAAAGATPRGGGTAAPDAAAKRDASAAALEAGTADGDGDDSCSVSTHACELSAPVGSLTEPCDAMTTAVVAASCPDTMAAQADGQRGDGGGGGENAETAQGGSSSRTPPAMVEILEADHHTFMLKKMGLLTALALFVHNFPEGLATFVGALADTKVGVGLAVAIAMHNIPEGICVAMPIYYATGSRWKGFWWAFMSGVSEPIGGLFGYLVLNGNNELSFAIVFGIVAGMMVYISIKELIPTALRYDPKDTLTTTCVIAGMVVMAASLLLFTI